MVDDFKSIYAKYNRFFHHDGYADAIASGKLDEYGHPIKTGSTVKTQRDSEYVELDIGAGVLWCKYCGRSHCPLFKTQKGKDIVLKQIEKNTQVSNGRVALDVYNPDYRYVLVLTTLSHVGCCSFSNVDVPDKKPVRVDSDENPDFLEILDDVYAEEVKK